jgi:hypothetical protein
MRAAFCEIAGALVLTLLCVETSVSETAMPQAAPSVLRMVQNDSYTTPSTSMVRAPALPQHGAGERTQDGVPHTGTSKTSSPAAVLVGAKGARKPTVLGRQSTDSSLGSLGPIYQLPRSKSGSGRPIANETGGGTTASTESMGQSIGEPGAMPSKNLQGHSVQPTERIQPIVSNGTASALSSVQPSSRMLSPEMQSQEGTNQSAVALPSTSAIPAPSWNPENLETAIAPGSLTRPSVTTDPSASPETRRSKGPASITDTMNAGSKTADVNSVSPDKIGRAGELVDSNPLRDKQRGGAGDHAIGPTGVLTEPGDSVETPTASIRGSNNDAKTAVEISPSTLTTQRSNQSQRAAGQPSSAVEQGRLRNELLTASAAAVTEQQTNAAPAPIAASGPTASSSLGSVSTSPVLFFLPFFPLLLLVYFGLRLS